MELVCIQCPLGCHLKVEEVDGKYVVTGNNCPRGEKYAINEMTCPMRTLTSTVKLKGARIKSLPVITSKQIPKEKMFEVMKSLKNIEVEAPINQGEVIIKNVCGLDSDIIASRKVERL